MLETRCAHRFVGRTFTRGICAKRRFRILATETRRCRCAAGNGIPAGQNSPKNTKAQRSPLGLNTIPLSPANFMNALILGAASLDCKPRPDRPASPTRRLAASRWRGFCEPRQEQGAFDARKAGRLQAIPNSSRALTRISWCFPHRPSIEVTFARVFAILRHVGMRRTHSDRHNLQPARQRRRLRIGIPYGRRHHRFRRQSPRAGSL